MFKKQLINLAIVLFFGLLSIYFVIKGHILESIITLIHGTALFLIHEALQKIKK